MGILEIKGFKKRNIHWWDRWIFRIELMNHPSSNPWPDFPDSQWVPRWEWMCTLTDWLTKGYAHD